MERRTFIKNIGAIAVISQIGIDKAIAKETKEVYHNLILQNKTGKIKMKLVEMEANLLSPSTIYFEAIIDEYTLSDLSGIMEMIYTPDKNTEFLGRGYIIDWYVTLDGEQVRVTFQTSGAMLMH